MKASTSFVAAAGAATTRRGRMLSREWRPEVKLTAGNDGGDGGGTSSICVAEVKSQQICNRWRGVVCWPLLIKGLYYLIFVFLDERRLPQKVEETKK